MSNEKQKMSHRKSRINEVVEIYVKQHLIMKIDDGYKCQVCGDEIPVSSKFLGIDSIYKHHFLVCHRPEYNNLRKIVKMTAQEVFSFIQKGLLYGDSYFYSSKKRMSADWKFSKEEWEVLEIRGRKSEKGN